MFSIYAREDNKIITKGIINVLIPISYEFIKVIVLISIVYKFN